VVAAAEERRPGVGAIAPDVGAQPRKSRVWIGTSTDSGATVDPDRTAYGDWR
jgi:hypothetical protein